MKMVITFDGKLPVIACITSWVLGIITIPICLNIFNTIYSLFLKAKTTRIRHGSVEEDEEEDGMKLVLCVRTDLGMGRGKIAAQCGHASIGAYLDGIKSKCTYMNDWIAYGQRKVVVKIRDYDEMKSIYKEAKKQNINTHITCDAGKTQVPSGSYTVIAVGPGPENIINNITGHLKLL